MQDSTSHIHGQVSHTCPVCVQRAWRASTGLAGDYHPSEPGDCRRSAVKQIDRALVTTLCCLKVAVHFPTYLLDLVGEQS
jgi:hypothetical protein